MSTDMIRMDGVYCALCDEYFFDKRQRAEHIMNSNDHPECWRCGRRFLNGQILRRHCVTAPNHHYCVPCDKHCRTAAGFRVHMEQVHGSDDDDSDDDDSEEEDYYDLEDGWEDERGEEEYPDEVSESGDESLDTSWEDNNEYDFEDPEYLRLPPSFNDAATDDAEESDEDVEETSSFSCPMCQKEHTTLCATPCGHVLRTVHSRCAEIYRVMSRLRRKSHRGPAPEDIYLSGVMKPNGSVVSHEVFKLLCQTPIYCSCCLYTP